MRMELVNAARGWLGVPYQHQHRDKKVGVDCAGLIIGSAKELGLVPEDFDINGYERVPDGKSLLAQCDQWMDRIPKEGIEPGDVVVIKWERDPQHLAIVAPYKEGFSVIHSINGRGVIEHRLTPSLSKMIVAAYRLKWPE